MNGFERNNISFQEEPMKSKWLASKAPKGKGLPTDIRFNIGNRCSQFEALFFFLIFEEVQKLNFLLKIYMAIVIILFHLLFSFSLIFLKFSMIRKQFLYFKNSFIQERDIINYKRRKSNGRFNSSVERGDFPQWSRK